MLRPIFVSFVIIILYITPIFHDYNVLVTMTPKINFLHVRVGVLGYLMVHISIKFQLVEKGIPTAPTPLQLMH